MRAKFKNKHCAFGKQCFPFGKIHHVKNDSLVPTSVLYRKMEPQPRKKVVLFKKEQSDCYDLYDVLGFIIVDAYMWLWVGCLTAYVPTCTAQ